MAKDFTNTLNPVMEHSCLGKDKRLQSNSEKNLPSLYL